MCRTPVKRRIFLLNYASSKHIGICVATGSASSPPLPHSLFLLLTYYVYAVCVWRCGKQRINHAHTDKHTYTHTRTIDNFQWLWHICGSVKPIRNVIKVRSMRRMRNAACNKSACNINECIAHSSRKLSLYPFSLGLYIEEHKRTEEAEGGAAGEA